MSIDAPDSSGLRASAHPAQTVHAGRLIARRLKASGIDTVFTLSGGHLFSLYDGCRSENIRLIDTRHEQTAAFAAEGWSKVTRVPGVAALTAGPGVTNGMSAMAAAQQNQSPLLVLGGRAPAARWGMGSLQEIDHVPFVAPLARFAGTADSAAAAGTLVDDALRATVGAPSGVGFVDFPMDYVFSQAEDDGRPGALADLPAPPACDPVALDRAVALLAGAERPVIMAGTNVWWGDAEADLLRLAEAQRIPVLMNGMARGTVPADHDLAFSRARSRALGQADVALVVGVPMDFRLGFGAAFGEGTEIVAIDVAAPARAHPRAVAAELYGNLSRTLGALREAAAAGGAGATGTRREEWIARLRAEETQLRDAERGELEDERAPLHPMRVYGELRRVLERDAIVIGDGGDFVSYAGRLIDSYEPGCWLDPGPYGCLGTGPGYALAAKLAHPERQVVLLLGDGAFGFAGIELDTLARHGVGVVGVVGNNGIWGLEKHPMEFLYGYSVAAELRPGTRYDLVAQALGCEGELVERPEQLRGALERALSGGRPALVNVLTDPAVAYPRRSNLA